MHFPHQPELRQEPESLLKPEKQKRSQTQSCAALAVPRPRGIVYETRICIVSLRFFRFLRDRGSTEARGRLPAIRLQGGRRKPGRGRQEPSRTSHPSRRSNRCGPAAPVRSRCSLSHPRKGQGSRSKERRGPRRGGFASQKPRINTPASTPARRPVGKSPRLGLLGSGVLQLIAHETKSDSHSLSDSDVEPLRSEPLRRRELLCCSVQSRKSLWAHGGGKRKLQVCKLRFHQSRLHGLPVTAFHVTNDTTTRSFQNSTRTKMQCREANPDAACHDGEHVGCLALHVNI